MCRDRHPETFPNFVGKSHFPGNSTTFLFPPTTFLFKESGLKWVATAPTELSTPAKFDSERSEANGRGPGPIWAILKIKILPGPIFYYLGVPLGPMGSYITPDIPP